MSTLDSIGSITKTQVRGGNRHFKPFAGRAEAVAQGTDGLGYGSP